MKRPLWLAVTSPVGGLPFGMQETQISSSVSGV